ncbi:MAG: hypothetical protein ABL961_18070, partial [Vicinamibacterales bacterium]
MWRRRWVRVTALVTGVPLLLLVAVGSYYYVTFGRLIDAQLHGERTRVLPRIYARPLELRVGQSMTPTQLVDRLNDLGYAQRATPEKIGEFAVDPDAITISPRPTELKGQTIKVLFHKPTAAAAKGA